MIKHKGDLIQLIGTITVFSLILATFAHVAMTPEYWDRGQPPSVDTLYKNAKQRLALQIQERSEQRSDLAPQAAVIDKVLEKANMQLKNGNIPALITTLEEARDNFVSIETSLSIGSRAPYGELAGQLRHIIGEVQKGKKTNPNALGLWSSRTISFLARELEVASPIKPIK